jgi:hypothetical protein
MSVEAPTSGYSAPVYRLLALGRPDLDLDAHDYREMGIGPEHVDELIRMALDPDLAGAEEPEFYAHVHAWRALAQLHAEAAIEPLAELLHRPEVKDNDWALEEIPEVLAMMGPVATPVLLSLLGDKSLGDDVRLPLTDGVRKHVELNPSERAAVVAALVREVDDETNSGELVAFAILQLGDLRATEAVPSIERAFDEDRVDTFVAGDWEDVQVHLGMIPERLTPRPLRPLVLPALDRPTPPPPTPGPRRGSAAKTKAKKKQEKQSRRKNRRK